MKSRIYITLTVYNYDTSPRWQTIEHDCRSIEHAAHVVARLQKLIKGNHRSTGITRLPWLERNHRIYGTLERIDGVFLQLTGKIS